MWPKASTHNHHLTTRDICPQTSCAAQASPASQMTAVDIAETECMSKLLVRLRARRDEAFGCNGLFDTADGKVESHTKRLMKFSPSIPEVCLINLLIRGSDDER